MTASELTTATRAALGDRPLLTLRALTRTYRAGDVEVRALDGVDLTVARGEFVAVMGPSGCGKSTLLHLIGGLDRPTSGEMELNGKRVDGLSETRWAVLRRRAVGYVFQQFNLLASLTAASNVELPALLAGHSSAEATRRRERLFAALALGDRAQHLPARLSGGQQQRVAIARALINEPELLLADEPTGNLDTASARDVMALIAERHRHGQTVVLVTHDARIAATADRVVRMRDGRIVSESVMNARADTRSRIADLIAVEA